MTVTPGIRALIREGKNHQIYSAIQTGSRDGMYTLEQSLYGLAQEGMISMEDALMKANQPQEIQGLGGHTRPA